MWLVVLAIVLAVSVGHSFTFALQCDRDWMFSFGSNSQGQLGHGQPPWSMNAVAVDSSGALDGKTITSIASHGSHSLVLTATGQVFSFGLNNYGQLGDGTNTESNTPVAVSTSGVLNGKTITAIAAGDSHSLVLSATGEVFSFGFNNNGQLGDGTITNSNTPVAVSTSGVLNGKTITAIAAGGYHSLVLASTGDVFSFGNNNNGQLGDGTNSQRAFPVAVNTSGVLDEQPIIAIACGLFHSLVLSETGEVFSFGWNLFGQLGDGTTTARNTPVAVSTSGVLNGKTITAIASGSAHSLVLAATGEVFSFGFNSDGQLGDGTTTARNIPVAVDVSGALKGFNITGCAAGSGHSLVYSATGEAFSFGDNSFGQLGDGILEDKITPVAVNISSVLSAGQNITAVACGGSHSLVVSSGKVFSFGSNSNGQLGDNKTTTDQTTHKFFPVLVAKSDGLGALEPVAISAGDSHSLVLTASSQVFSFGLNENGQLGDGTTQNAFSPVAVSMSGVLNGTYISAISAGGSHSLVLSAIGQVFSFGLNDQGQLGDGSATNRYSPVSVDASGMLNGTNCIAISAGGSHSLVLSETGQVFSFGNNAEGQLGDGTTTNRYFPVSVNTSGVLNGMQITAISAGGSHSLVLSATGQVFSFGNNQFGQLGDGTNVKKSLPVAVNSSDLLSGIQFIAISAGSFHSLVLSATGQVFSFGNNQYGQLGDGTIVKKSFPVPMNSSAILNGMRITAISAGDSHSLVLSATGQVFSFGNNVGGQLGDGTSTKKSLPIAVDTSGALNGLQITGISAGSQHSLVQSFSVINATIGAVRDGKSPGEQTFFQPWTDKVMANWNAFHLFYSQGRSQNARAYNITTIEKDSGQVVLGPQIVTLAVGESIFMFESSPDVSLQHNTTYFTTVSIKSYCYDISASSMGFLVDSTPPIVVGLSLQSNVWTIGTNFSFECSEISDPESGIDRAEILIIDSATNATLSLPGCELVIVGAVRHFELSWPQCGTQLVPATPLRVAIIVINRAGSNATVISTSEFQVSGTRITSLLDYNGGQSSVFKVCRRVTVKWASAGLDGTPVVLSLLDAASGNAIENITHRPIAVERAQYQWEPIPASVTPGRYRIKLTPMIGLDQVPSALSQNITIEASDVCIIVTSPNGASNLEVGESMLIQWDCTGNTQLVEKVMFQLLNEGHNPQLINSSTSISTGMLNWTIPMDLNSSNSFQVKATVLGVQGVQGVVFTTNFFQILNPNADLSSDTPPPTVFWVVIVLIFSMALVIGILALCLVAVVVVVVAIFMAIFSKRRKTCPDLEMSTAQMVFDPDADLTVEEEEASPTVGSSKSSALSTALLSSDERALAEKVITSFSKSRQCSPPESSSPQRIGDWLRVSTFLLETADTKQCAMEMACSLWKAFGTDACRREALRQYPQLLVLLQSCVHKTDSSDWSFIERIQQSMDCFDSKMTISQLELLEELGSGAFGSVHAARRTDTGEEVAVKIVKHMKLGFTGSTLQQVIDVRKIKREILIMSILAMDNNPYLIRFMGYQVEEMRILIMMARAEGSVKDLLQENRLLRKPQGGGTNQEGSPAILSVKIKLDIAIQVGEALAYLHSFQIAHRDLKSENILLMNKVTPENPNVSVRLIDFGISRATQDAHSTFIQGTVSWAAPEVLAVGDSGTSPFASGGSDLSSSSSSSSRKKTKVNVTTAVDVYSFAYLLWALLTEREPHSNYGHSVAHIKSQVRSNANCPLVIPALDQLPDAGSADRFDSKMFEAYGSILLKCWQAEPCHRPTMPQVVQQLNSIKQMMLN